jgi:hypothetical protein
MRSTPWILSFRTHELDESHNVIESALQRKRVRIVLYSELTRPDDQHNRCLVT